jgi:histone H3/H4
MSDARKKRSAFARSPLRRLMKKHGGNIVAKDALDILIRNLEEVSIKLTQKALMFAKHSKRKKINKEDMHLAIKYL